MASLGGDCGSEKVYHYTDKKGMDGILEIGVIKQTQINGRDAILGEGVYVNKLPPHQFSKAQVAFNNYDGTTSYRQVMKTDYAIELKVPVQKLEKLEDTSRSVYCYRGDVPLDENVRIHRVDY